MISLTITGKPTTKKNSARLMRRRDGTPFVMPSAAACRWTAEAKRQLRQQYQGAPLLGPLAVTYRVLRQNRQHEGDLGNYVSAIDDALQAAGVIADDKQIVLSTASKGLDAAHPRVEITIHAVAQEAA